MSEAGDRHSIADPVELILDPTAKARREAENGVRQFNSAMATIGQHILHGTTPFRLKQRLIIELHQHALKGIHPLAGTYRNSSIAIGNSNHVPPAHVDVPDLVAEMCAYVNDTWDERNAVQLAAYVLWRMNWIHPFSDGNGRTARAVSYVVLCTKLMSLLPGTPTIPDQISDDKGPYYRALEDADHLWQFGRLALSSLEAMLERMLTVQLRNAIEEASGAAAIGRPSC